MSNEIEVQSSSGNVFADMGLQNTEELLIKAELVRQISRMIDIRKMTQTEAAQILSIGSTKSLSFVTWQAFRVLNRTSTSILKCTWQRRRDSCNKES